MEREDASRVDLVRDFLDRHWLETTGFELTTPLLYISGNSLPATFSKSVANDLEEGFLILVRQLFNCVQYVAELRFGMH
jgi:hypothetical protein